jgi:hypothetical protein
VAAAIGPATSASTIPFGFLKPLGQAVASTKQWDPSVMLRQLIERNGAPLDETR